MPLRTRTIASLALVKLTWDHLKHDYLDAFVPFVATLLRAGRYEGVFDRDVHRLCDDFAATFGFNVPYHPMIAILNRAKKRGLLTRWQGRFLPVWDLIEENDLSENAAKQEKRLDELVDRFIRFAQEGYGRSLNREEAHQGLIAFLKVP